MSPGILTPIGGGQNGDHALKQRAMFFRGSGRRGAVAGRCRRGEKSKRIIHSG
jgi:hypothetical protein